MVIEMKTQSIFIVEDEIITARSIAKNIKKFGYRLAGIATSGSEALEQILTINPDLILMDILLQDNDELDGIATAQRILSQINVPIIYLTAHSDRETLDKAKVTTPFGYILKPYSKKNLQITIEIALYKHQQEMQLVRREQLLSTILNAAQDGVVATDKASRIIYMNPAAQKLTGWNLQEAHNRRATEVLEIIDRRTQQPIPHPIERVLEQGQVVYLDDYAVLIKKDGKQTPIADSVSPILQPGDRSVTVDRVEGAVLIFTLPRDFVVARDKNQSSKLATLGADCQFNELSVYLIDLLLHELRSPLTVILSTAESLQRYRQRWTVAQQDQSLERIQQAIGQVTRLLDNVTIWEELGREQLTLQPDWIDIIDLSQDILSDLCLIDRNHHQLIMSHRVEERIFYLDREIVQYILNNLLLNSIKYSPQGSTISLSIEHQASELILRIQDRGIGIPLAEQEQIFEPFYRASNTDGIKGTGLGLAIVREYVRLCRGEIGLESSSDRGTTFVVSLPSNG